MATSLQVDVMATGLQVDEHTHTHTHYDERDVRDASNTVHHPLKRSYK